MAMHSGPDAMVKSNVQFSFFSIGENIVEKIGLFDEYIYPAYFEDNDYQDRIEIAGYAHLVVLPDIPADDSGGSQTIKSNEKLLMRNHETFVANQNYYQSKKNSGDYTPRGWSLHRRRSNDWDRILRNEQ
jgi:GT2 family glycosyltransferase